MAAKKNAPATLTQARIAELGRMIRKAETLRDEMHEAGQATAMSGLHRQACDLRKERHALREQEATEAAARLASAPVGEVAEQLVEAIRSLPAELRAQVLSAVEGRPRAVR